MAIFRFVGLLVIPAILAGCQEKRVLATERSGTTSSRTTRAMDRRPDRATVVIDRAPDPTSGEDLASVPELRGPIWATEASRQPDAGWTAPPAAESDHDACEPSPGGQEREEAEQPPR